MKSKLMWVVWLLISVSIIGGVRFAIHEGITAINSDQSVSVYDYILEDAKRAFPNTSAAWKDCVARFASERYSSVEETNAVTDAELDVAVEALLDVCGPPDNLSNR